MKFRKCGDYFCEIPIMGKGVMTYFSQHILISHIYCLIFNHTIKLNLGFNCSQIHIQPMYETTFNNGTKSNLNYLKVLMKTICYFTNFSYADYVPSLQ